MTIYIEFHALHNVPPANMNRDDAGSPKTAFYGGTIRARVSSQCWKRAIREDFSATVEPSMVGTRSRMLVEEIAHIIKTQQPELAEQAEALAVAAMEAAGFKKPVPKTRKGSPSGIPETGYLVFLSQIQMEKLAAAAIAASSEDDPLASMKASKVKNLVDADHSIDIALFGRMVADSTDLNVDASCQVAHAISVHEATTEYDFYTAVDDAKARDEDETDAGAGMMGTVGFVSSTLYRYAAINTDQLVKNLGNIDAARLAVEAFSRSFVNALPSAKQNSFGNATRPSAVMITVGEGQPTSLVGAFEEPVKPSPGYMKPAEKALAKHAQETFETWRKPDMVKIVGLPSDVEQLKHLGDVTSLDEAVEAVLDEVWGES